MLGLLIWYRSVSCGAFVAAIPLLRWYGSRYILGLAVMVQGISIILVAFPTQLYLTTMVFCVYGIARATLCLVGISLCSHLGRKKYSFVFVQFFFVGNSFGFSAGTFIQKGFVSQRLDNVSAGLEYCREHPVPDCEDEYIWMFYSKSCIYIPYAVFGGIAVPLGLVCIALDKIRADDHISGNNSVVEAKTRKMWIRYCSILVSIFEAFLVAVGIPALCKMLLVSELVRSDAQVQKGEAVLISAVFFAVKVIGEISVCVLNGRVSPIHISMVATLMLVVTTSVSGALVSFGKSIYWLFSATTSIFASMVVPPLGAYVCSEFPKDIVVVAVFEIAISAGLFAVPTLVVYLQREESFQAYIFCHTIIAALSLVATFFMYVYMKKVKPGLSPDASVKAVLLMESDDSDTVEDYELYTERKVQ